MTGRSLLDVHIYIFISMSFSGAFRCSQSLSEWTPVTDHVMEWVKTVVFILDVIYIKQV